MNKCTNSDCYSDHKEGNGCQTIRLSILIPSLVTRGHWLKRLMTVLEPQLEGYGGIVQVINDIDNGEASIGAKRNNLLRQSYGLYSVYLDDDDLIAPDYVRTIVDATKANADAIGYWVRRYSNGVREARAFHSMRAMKYGQATANGEFIYLRTINHICPVKTSLARKVRFLDINSGEDNDYADRLHRLLKTELFIDREMYHYYFRTMSQRQGERTNANALRG